MLTVFSKNLRYARRIATTIAKREATLWVESWQELERAHPDTSCAVVVLDWLRDDLGERRLRSLKERYPLQPIVLVTSKDADNARDLRSAGVEEVVWLSEIEVGLWPAVSRAKDSGFLRPIIEAVDRSLFRYPLLRRSIGYACRAVRPVRSIAQLAAVSGCDRRTLWRHWHDAVAPRVALRLEDVLDWLILLHAVGRKEPSRSWSSVAAGLQIHPHTLGRICARLTGRSLRMLTAADQLPLAIQFDGHINRAVGGEPARSMVSSA
ncbi:MAG: hypothetical protein QOH59_3071 [Gemmatimonadales bacterium]|nr:hypothetical protein [Gemmatimonadales bacterium]